MKTTQKFILALGLLVLTACGDDSSGGSNDGFSGNKSEINQAKKLVQDYEVSGGYFEKGYVSYNNVKKNLQFAETSVSYAQNFQDKPDSFYAMRYVGCLAPDGTALPSQQNKHTQMDVVVGAKSNRAIYIQQNSLSRCYLGQINWGHNINLNGYTLDHNAKSRGIFGLDTDICQDYSVEESLVRISKEKLGHSKNNNNKNNNLYNTPYYQHSWRPDKDFYYDVKGNNFGQFSRHNVAADSTEDSFGKINSDEAVFVTKALRNRSSGPSCAKDVYWGYQIDPQNPPEVQILGKN